MEGSAPPAEGTPDPAEEGTPLVRTGLDRRNAPEQGHAEGEALLRTKLNSKLPVVVQWLLSFGILAGIIVWLAIGNVAECTIGHDCSLDAWLVPLGGGVLAYVAAFGFFSVPAKKALGTANFNEEGWAQ